MDQPDLTPPNFEEMAQGAALFAQQVVRCRNLPAVDAGAAILARLDGLSDQVAALTSSVTAMTSQMAVLNGQVAALNGQMTDLARETRAKSGHEYQGEAPKPADYGPQCPPHPTGAPGAVIPGFPATPAALSALSGQELTNILTTLGEQVHPDASPQEKKRMLRAAIGLVDIS
ncbi:MAG: hypothetical protein M1840_004354 [Geoglossum simile]|nr:MAG: hypothetical protein M1840_004354 [Geoglossum simile]